MRHFKNSALYWGRRQRCVLANSTTFAKEFDHFSYNRSADRQKVAFSPKICNFQKSSKPAKKRESGRIRPSGPLKTRFPKMDFSGSGGTLTVRSHIWALEPKTRNFQKCSKPLKRLKTAILSIIFDIVFISINFLSLSI